jgi:hypothetical protein
MSCPMPSEPGSFTTPGKVLYDPSAAGSLIDNPDHSLPIEVLANRLKPATHQGTTMTSKLITANTIRTGRQSRPTGVRLMVGLPAAGTQFFGWLAAAAILLGGASVASANQQSATADNGSGRPAKAETERKGPSQAEIAMAADLAKILVEGGRAATALGVVRALTPERIGCQTINCPNGGR